jgi:hypothetical protein
MDFNNFDRRNYPTVPARTGYGEWASDGIDLTPEMLERARAKSLYRSLFLGSVEETGISHARYDLRFVIVGMHPFFFMTGMPTHFKDSDGVVDEEWLRASRSGNTSETTPSISATSGKEIHDGRACLNVTTVCIGAR